MRALCKSTPQRGCDLIDAPMPEVSSDNVLIQVKAATICGTDFHIYQWDPWSASRIKTPLIFGHEFAGEVVEVGPDVKHIKVGDRVSAESHIPCGKCYQCRTGQMHLCQHLLILGVDRQGGFAEFAAVPEICCVKFPKNLSWEVAAAQEPFGNAVYTVSESEVSGKSVVIFGDGPIGIFAAAIARVYGATTLIACGMQPKRLQMMKDFGADTIVNVRDTDPVAAIMDATQGRGVDVVLEMSGAPKAIHDGFKVVRRGGSYTFFGIPSKPVEINLAEEMIFKGLSMRAINGRLMFRTWYEIANLLESGRIDISPVINRSFSFAEIDQAMNLLAADTIEVGKIALHP